MNQEQENPIVRAIGIENFKWLAAEFNQETRLEDIPSEILDRICSVDITIRNYSSDPNAISAIALITFAYKLAGKEQQPHYGSNDLLLVKVLAKNERSRRGGKDLSSNRMWGEPFFELITGEVGERIRGAKFVTNPP